MPNSIRNPGLLVLAEIIVSARRRLSLSQVELARRLPCDPATIANIELGLRRVDVIELVVIARALELSVSEIIADVEKAVAPDHSFRKIQR